MPGHERPMPNSRWEERVKYEEIIHKCHILNKLPVRTNVSMEIWRKKTRITRMLQCLPSTIWSVLKNAAFLDTRQCCRRSDCIVLSAKRHSAVPIWNKPFRVSLRAVSVQLLNSFGLDDEIFLIEESGVKSALFSSLALVSFFFSFWRWALPRFCDRVLERTAGPK